MSKRYKCPYCSERKERKDLIIHVEKIHTDRIPEDYTPARIVFNSINHKENGTCRVCGKITPWNEKHQRYDMICEDPKCKKVMRDAYKNNMLRVRGTYNILNDPEQQKKMLANRKISGKYRFQDGDEIEYTGSYEKKALEFMENVMQLSSKDIVSPGPTMVYMYDGKEHYYIPDFYLPEWNLIIEIKDGGDNSNKQHSIGRDSSRAKTIEKERMITNKGEYNYIRLTNNQFNQLLEIFMELKEQRMNGIDKPIVKINEFTIKSYGLKSTNIIIDEFLTITKNTKLYHGSNKQGLKQIDPKRESINAKVNNAAVFTSPSKAFAACFGFEWHDNIAKQGSWDNYKTVVMGISDKIDLSKPCSLYEIENDGSGNVLNKNEVLFDHPVKVINEIKYNSAKEMLEDNGVKLVTLDSYKANVGTNKAPKFEYINESSIITEGSYKTYYRVTYKGKGIYEALKAEITKTPVGRDIWKLFLKNNNWLDKPDVYSDGYTKYSSYFTELGYQKFLLSDDYRLACAYLDKDNIKVKKYGLDSSKSVYEDDDQIVMREYTYTSDTRVKVVNITSYNDDGILNEVKCGEFGNKEIKIYGDEGPVPHIHITQPNKPDCCICIYEPKYFSHGSKTVTLSKKEMNDFIKALKAVKKSKSKNQINQTNWERCASIWEDLYGDKDIYAKNIPDNYDMPKYKYDMPLYSNSLTESAIYESNNSLEIKWYDIHSAEGKEYASKGDKDYKKYEPIINDYIGYVLVDDNTDTFIGWYMINNKKDKGFITPLYVDKKYRGRGIGKLMLKDAIYNGGIDLVVDKDNDIAINMYQKSGFKIVKDLGNQYYMKLKSKLD